MGTLKSNVIEPATGTNLSLGASGDVIDVTSDTLQLNTWKDSGGNTLFTSDGSGTLSSINSALDIGGGPNLIQSQTASSSAAISFTSGIDSTYDKYMFVFVNINPVSSSSVNFQFQGNVAGGSGYNETMTSTFFYSWHNEADNDAGLAYQADHDQAQGTAFQPLAMGMGNASDRSWNGILYLFSPSSTTYVKQFYSTVVASRYSTSAYCFETFAAGYFNTTSAIDEIQFKMSSGNINAGTIKMYGCR